MEKILGKKTGLIRLREQRRKNSWVLELGTKVMTDIEMTLVPTVEAQSRTLRRASAGKAKKPQLEDQRTACKV